MLDAARLRTRSVGLALLAIACGPAVGGDAAGAGTNDGSGEAPTGSLPVGCGDGEFADDEVCYRAIDLGVSASNVALGDINGDGLLDLVAFDDEATGLTVLTSTAPGTFVVEATLVGPDTAVRRLLVADFDGDGDADVVLAGVSTVGQAGDSLWWYENRGGSLLAASVSSGWMGLDPVAIDLGDDGRSQIVGQAQTGEELPGPAQIQPYTLGGGMLEPLGDPALAPFCLVQDAEVHDLDRDGLLDIIAAGSCTEPTEVPILALRGLADGRLTSMFDLAAGTDPFRVAVGRHEEKGLTLVAVVAVSDKVVRLFSSTTGLEFIGPDDLELGPRFGGSEFEYLEIGHFGFAEVRGGGGEEILFQGRRTDDDTFGLFARGAEPGTEEPFLMVDSVGDGQKVAVADINADGISDIAVARTAARQRSVTLLLSEP